MLHLETSDRAVVLKGFQEVSLILQVDVEALILEAEIQAVVGNLEEADKLLDKADRVHDTLTSVHSYLLSIYAGLVTLH